LKLRLGQSGKFRARRNGLVPGVKPLVLREIREIVGDQRQTGVVRHAQRFAVHDRVQVRNRRPHAYQPLAHVLDRLGKAVPGIRTLAGKQTFQRAAVFAQHMIERRADVFRKDGAETGRLRDIEQGVAGERGVFHVELL
jgi:hypothetical protein